ncbi:MAG: MarR family transcriptional regulator [Actinobacteria bacterium]|nr:MarR family transcriptional regulator [Actinomycetota bacterium]
MDREPDDAEAGMLAAVLRLFSRWSSLDVQRAVAGEAGVAAEATDIRALYALGLHGAPVRPSALAEELQLTRPTASKMLARLHAADLVARREDPEDRRAALVVLAPAGEAAFTRLHAAGVDMMRAGVRAWTAEERVRFAGALTRFVDALTSPDPSRR